jgi:hypothetical protein
MKTEANKPKTPVGFAASGLLCCAGCGAVPINVGNMGRWKYVCPTYMARKSETTPRCDGGQMRPMWTLQWDAADDWNRDQQHNVRMSEGADK